VPILPPYEEPDPFADDDEFDDGVLPEPAAQAHAQAQAHTQEPPPRPVQDEPASPAEPQPATNGQAQPAPNGQRSQPAPNGQQPQPAASEQAAPAPGQVAQQIGSAPAPAAPTASNGHDHTHSGRYDAPIGPDEVYDQEADEATYNEAMDNPAPPEDAPTAGKKEHVA
jgi:hypothetical protein